MKFCLALLFTNNESYECWGIGPQADPNDLSPNRDCQELGKTFPGLDNGVYVIHPTGYPTPFEVYCDFTTDGGGWTVIQRRDDGSVDFYLGWEDYKHGFGDLQTEFWLGNDKIYSLTNQKRYELRIEMTGERGPQYYAKYTYFRISDEDNWYKLSIGSFSGSVGYDALIYHNGMYFSTKDADHDIASNECAVDFHGAWWFKSCYYSNLNGKNGVRDGIRWYKHPGGERNLKYAEMKIRAL